MLVSQWWRSWRFQQSLWTENWKVFSAKHILGGIGHVEEAVWISVLRVYFRHTGCHGAHVFSWDQQVQSLGRFQCYLIPEIKTKVELSQLCVLTYYPILNINNLNTWCIEIIWDKDLFAWEFILWLKDKCFWCPLTFIISPFLENRMYVFVLVEREIIVCGTHIYILLFQQLPNQYANNAVRWK